MRSRRGKILFSVFVLALAANVVFPVRFFLNSGGRGLARIAWYYLLRDIPDKRYGWRDFIDRGPQTPISGFYSGGDASGFYLWTLSGRKRFSHRPGVSVYQFNDVCAAVRQWGEGGEQAESARVENRVSGEISEWREWLEPEFLVTVLRLEEGGGGNAVHTAKSMSGKYKVFGQLTGEQCE